MLGCFVVPFVACATHIRSPDIRRALLGALLGCCMVRVHAVIGMGIAKLGARRKILKAIRRVRDPERHAHSTWDTGSVISQPQHMMPSVSTITTPVITNLGLKYTHVFLVFFYIIFPP